MCKKIQIRAFIKQIQGRCRAMLFFAQRLILKWATWNSPLGNHDYRVKNPFDIELILGFWQQRKGNVSNVSRPEGPIG